MKQESDQLIRNSSEVKLHLDLALKQILYVTMKILKRLFVVKLLGFWHRLVSNFFPVLFLPPFISSVLLSFENTPLQHPLVIFIIGIQAYFNPTRRNIKKNPPAWSQQTSEIKIRDGNKANTKLDFYLRWGSPRVMHLLSKMKC